MKKVILIIITTIVIAIAGGLSFLKFGLPNTGPAPKLKIEATADRVARGEYLANHVCVCIDCHSSRDWDYFSGPPKDGTFGMGGDIFPKEAGFPGDFFARNITPIGIGDWTDGELYRTITTGVNKKGEALFPIMPYHYYGQMDDEDIHSIIAYIRTLKPIENEVRDRQMGFPFSLIINTIPHKGVKVKRPEPSDKVNYGKYLTNAAACIECHTKADDKAQLIAGTEFGGGRPFPLPFGGQVVTPNISPDMETGIGSWSKEKFVALFHARSDSATLHTKVPHGQFQTLMPWTMYGKMTDQDLEAIYTYLRTVPAIKNNVAEKFIPKA